MASYSRWNEAVHAYFLGANARGASAFLGVDDDALVLMARSLSPVPRDAVGDFCHAVRQQCVIGGRVGLHMVPWCEPQWTAGGAFLALLVLAATRMTDDEAASGSAYFVRLRELLGLPKSKGDAVRPPGLDAGDEVSLWQEWNAWAQKRGFVPSARPGTNVQDKYRGYAIGQSLLRDVDKKTLERTFEARRFGTLWDGDEVLRQTRRASDHLTTHLRELIADDRGPIAADRIFEVYEAWSQARHQTQREAGDKSNAALGQPNRAPQAVGKTLFCGLLRREHPFTGEASYHLLPRLRSHHGAAAGQLLLDEDTADWRALRALDERWWHDVGPLKTPDLPTGRRFSMRGDNGGDHVYAEAELPARECWVLVPDAMWGNPDFASWREPRLGEEFVLLAKAHLLEQLKPLRGRVLDWSGDPEPLEEVPGWAELTGLSIVATDWLQIELKSASLLEALRPRQHLHLSLAGGVRYPARAGCWMQGFAPSLQVHAVPFQHDAVTIELFAPGQSAPHSFEMAPNLARLLELTRPGVWRIEAQWMGNRAQTIAEIVAWDTAKMTPAPPEICARWGDWRWRGALGEAQPQSGDVL